MGRKIKMQPIISTKGIEEDTGGAEDSGFYDQIYTVCGFIKKESTFVCLPDPCKIYKSRYSNLKYMQMLLVMHQARVYPFVLCSHDNWQYMYRYNVNLDS